MRWTTFGTALVLLAIPTIASAHAGNNDPDMVHVCIGNVSKVVRSVGIGGVCIAGSPLLAETADHWPKHALAGPKGDKGDQGNQGIPGAQGNPGVNGADGASVTFVGYVPPGDATCPNGGAIFLAGGVNAYLCNGQDAATAATRPDPPCFEGVTIHAFNRYFDCGNGTVTDTVTGLIWLKRPVCLSRLEYGPANTAAAALKDGYGDCGLSDGSSPGDWRLPTKDEWQATLARGFALGCISPVLTNDAGTDCLSVGPSSFLEPEIGSDTFWSSSVNEFSPEEAWQANVLGDGVGLFVRRFHTLGVWPVRGSFRARQGLP